jgi:anthranilate/para-aminobenzoate synthase component I
VRSGVLRLSTHLVSIVTAELAQGQQGVLPRGIHYRGPKVRSTEIICKIEHFAREIYRGSIVFYRF